MHSRRAFGLRAFAAKLRGVVSGQRDGDEFEAEVGEHLRLLTERFVAQGMSREEAALAARRQFGNTTLLQEIVQDQAPQLLELPGVGPVTAATVLMVWSHPGRIRSEAAFA